MSTRWYPIFQKGNPQLRVYLPNFFMKLVRPDYKQPPNIVKFIVSNEMTNHDIRNYLEKIYKVKVADVRSNIVTGEFKTAGKENYIVKDDDYKTAYVTLPLGETFEFPKLISETIKEKEEKTLNDTQKSLKDIQKKFLEKNKNRHGLPGWYSI
ncbi:39S ribosomal protein L23, mitochondrial [Macrosteles quadrilineatus]|uniref:39S ribosomal protein L23, mitochondrial n=1 Tax=Macrosteles quadrilineatus TaxID=74068 RepID=UPI0023E2C5A1|nr:39S ribosomal protein L23, mitochondrial [Macrosteles quadrilineatus]